jgi:hypothetical protein
MATEVIGNGLGFEQIGVASDLTAAQGLSSLPSGRVLALCQCAKAVDSGTKGNIAVRWRNDGTAPTADIGQELAPGESILLDCGLTSLKFIGTAANAKVNVTYLPWSQYATPV